MTQVDRDFSLKFFFLLILICKYQFSKDQKKLNWFPPPGKVIINIPNIIKGVWNMILLAWHRIHVALTQASLNHVRSLTT